MSLYVASLGKGLKLNKNSMAFPKYKIFYEQGI